MFCAETLSRAFILNTEKSMNLPTKEIEKLLPHRKPFIFIDEITSASDEKIVAQSVFTEDKAYYTGHTSNSSVIPGTMLIEALIQVGEAGLNALEKFTDDSCFFLATLDNVKLRRQVHSKDSVRFEVSTIHLSQRMVKQTGYGYVDQDIVVEAEWMCVVGAQ